MARERLAAGAASVFHVFDPASVFDNETANCILDIIACNLESPDIESPFQPLDKQQLPNLANLNPELMAKIGIDDPRNAHGVILAWGTYGITYDEKKLAATCRIFV